MSTVIQAKMIGEDELVNLLKDLHCRCTFSYLIVSSWRDINFIAFSLDETERKDMISNSYTGRAFGKVAELRWRRSEDGKGFLCRWIADDDKYKLDDSWKALSEALNPPETTDYLLWGELYQPPSSDDCFWYQARIPRKLRYPIDLEGKDKFPLVLSVREYKQGGQTTFERFVELKQYTPQSSGKKDNESGEEGTS